MIVVTLVPRIPLRKVGYSTPPAPDKVSMIEGTLWIWRRRPLSGPISHSDRGGQYYNHDFRKLLKKNQMQSGMSRKGDCWDTQCIMPINAKPGVAGSEER